MIGEREKNHPKELEKEKCELNRHLKHDLLTVTHFALFNFSQNLKKIHKGEQEREMSERVEREREKERVKKR